MTLEQIEERVAALERRMLMGVEEWRFALVEAERDRDALRAKLAGMAPTEPEKCATRGLTRDLGHHAQCKHDFPCVCHPFVAPPPAESGERDPRRMGQDEIVAEVATLRAQLEAVTRERDAAQLDAEKMRQIAIDNGDRYETAEEQVSALAREKYRLIEERDAALAREQRLREALEEIRHRTDDALTPHEEAVWDLANAALAPEVKP